MMMTSRIRSRFRPIDGFDDAKRGPLALNRGRRKHDARVAAAERDFGDVVDRGARALVTTPMSTGSAGSGRLRSGAKSPSACSLFFRFLERLEESAAAGRARLVADELKTSARSPNRSAATELHAGAVRDELAGAKRRGAVHNALDQSVFALVLETKVDVAAGGRLGARHLAFDPHLGGGTLDGALETAIEIGDGVNLRFLGRRHGGAEVSTRWSASASPVSERPWNPRAGAAKHRRARMDRILPVLLLGFFLGMRHATDADHVVAVSTIVSRERSVRAAGMVGALWGIGHTVTILLVGGAILLFGVVISPRVGLTMEFSVALMLVLLGTMNLTGAMKRMDEVAHEHHHGKEAPAPHVHEAIAHGRSRLSLLRPLVVGVVHGLAGSAAVALLVLTTIHDAAWGLLYLLVFGIGTVGGWCSSLRSWRRRSATHRRGSRISTGTWRAQPGCSASRSEC